MNLQSSDFELFGLEPRFRQDRADIDARWKDLQRQAHPDRFAAQGAAAQRIAMQYSVRINEAYQRLKDPLRRAAALCESMGSLVQAESNTAMPADFLVEQMNWRETLDESHTLEAAQALQQQVDQSRRQVLERIEQLLDVEHDARAAVQQVRVLMFIERFAADVLRRVERLVDTA